VQPARDLLLNLLHTFLSVRREPQLLLVAPQDARSGGYSGSRQHLVQIHDLVLAVVADQHDQRPLFAPHTFLDEAFHSIIYSFFHHLVLQRPGRV